MRKRWDFVRPIDHRDVSVFVCFVIVCLLATNCCRFRSADHNNRSHEYAPQKKKEKKKEDLSFGASLSLFFSKTESVFRCAFKSTLNIKRKMCYLSCCVLEMLGENWWTVQRVRMGAACCVCEAFQTTLFQWNQSWMQRDQAWKGSRKE